MNATQQMAAFRPQMLSYAARQLGDDELAEDVVQAAFVAALLFRADGHWEQDAGPGTLDSPEQLCTNREFWQVLQRCLDGLPGIQAQVFMMREHLGLSTQEISTQTRLTGNNINVMLYRARLKLQKCLQQNWLGDDAARSPRTRKTDGHAA